MDKKILIGIACLIIFAIAYWLLSPFWRKVTLDEKLPGMSGTPIKNISDLPIKDNLSTMDTDTKTNFEKQTMEMKDKMMNKDDEMPVRQPTIIARANMIARAHEVQGTALLVKSDNETFLRFENLKTINGPDLRIYLSSGLNADDIVDLGPIRATEGNVNYTIPHGTDLAQYTNAMIWCRAFGVLFSYAQFK